MIKLKITNKITNTSTIVDVNSKTPIETELFVPSSYKLRKINKMNVSHAFILLQDDGHWSNVSVGYIYINLFGELIDFSLPIEFEIKIE